MKSSLQVGSSTFTAILSRMAMMRGWSEEAGNLIQFPSRGPANLTNLAKNPHPSNLVLGHNLKETYHHNIYAVGYEAWMDFYLPRAWRIVFVAEPTHRVPSAYYFIEGYTQTKPLPDGTVVRQNNDSSFASPTSPLRLQTV